MFLFGKYSKTKLVFVEAADCSSPDVMAECFLLMDSVVDFIPHPQE